MRFPRRSFIERSMACSMGAIFFPWRDEAGEAEKLLPTDKHLLATNPIEVSIQPDKSQVAKNDKIIIGGHDISKFVFGYTISAYVGGIRHLEVDLQQFDPEAKVTNFGGHVTLQLGDKKFRVVEIEEEAAEIQDPTGTPPVLVDTTSMGNAFRVRRWLAKS